MYQISKYLNLKTWRQYTLILNNLKTQLLDNKWSKSFSNQTVAVNTSKHAICLQFHLGFNISLYLPVDLIFNGLFLRLHRPYIFISLIFFSFLNRYAWSSNRKMPTIQQFISISNFFRIQHWQWIAFSVCGLCVSLILFFAFFDNFFQVSFFRCFVCIWKDRWL